MTGSRRTLVVVSGGLGQPSSTRLLADRLADATASAVRQQGVDIEVHVIELRDHAHELTNALLTGFAGSDLRKAMTTVEQADGLVAVTPIFSASYSGLFKTFFDVLEEGAIDGTPVLAGATGGTARHSLALEHAVRPLFTYLHAVVVPTSVYAATQDWGATGSTGNDPLSSRIERAGNELAALIAGAPRPRADLGDDDIVPFSELLGD